jgi:hypothetical protein
MTGLVAVIAANSSGMRPGGALLIVFGSGRINHSPTIVVDQENEDQELAESA